MKKYFWRIRYALYSRDLYAALRAGRGSKDHPLLLDDLKPLMKALRRMDYPDKPPEKKP